MRADTAAPKGAPRGWAGVVQRAVGSALIVFGTLVAAPDVARADEGGVSFWLPGEFGSFAAVPGQPGLSVASFYLHPEVSASANKTFQIGTQVVAGIQGRGDLVGFGPTYIFAPPVLGGQASVSLLGVGGRNWASVAATLTGPMGERNIGKPQPGPDFSRRFVSAGGAEVESGRQQLHDLRDRRHSRRRLQFDQNSRIWGSDTARSTAAPATPISIPRTSSNSRRWWA